MNEPILQLLGIARRAGALHCGRDAAVEAARGRNARLCLLAEDASPRLETEFLRIGQEKTEFPVIRIPYSMERLGGAIGRRAGVVAVTEEGFAKRLQELLTQSKEEA